ncbi:MAG: hypothetical protein O3B01_20565, partial [Planctomycetota bacterium]|nr:hypothetical protein [Planctomycetota bacterium]
GARAPRGLHAPRGVFRVWSPRSAWSFLRALAEREHHVVSTLRVEFFSEPSRSESTTWSPRSAGSFLRALAEREHH